MVSESVIKIIIYHPCENNRRFNKGFDKILSFMIVLIKKAKVLIKYLKLKKQNKAINSGITNIKIMMLLLK